MRREVPLPATLSPDSASQHPRQSDICNSCQSYNDGLLREEIAGDYKHPVNDAVKGPRPLLN